MVAPGLDLVNEGGRGAKQGIGGWLAVLCMLLLVGHPASLALSASTALDALAIRGLSLGLVLVARLTVTAVGVGAGIALLGQRPGAVTFARWALVLSALVDTFVYATPFYPNNRPPGITPLVIAASLAYHIAWLAYLFRSKRVRATFPP